MSPKGKPKQVIDLWRFEKITLCISKEILTEYFAVLGRFGLSREPEGQELIKLFQARYNLVYLGSLPSIFAIPEDPADNKFIECAVAAGASYIVSGDRHLQNLKSFKDITILPPTELLKLTQ